MGELEDHEDLVFVRDDAVVESSRVSISPSSISNFINSSSVPEESRCVEFVSFKSSLD